MSASRGVLAQVMRWQYRRWPLAGNVLAEAVLSLRPWDAVKTRLPINRVAFLPGLHHAPYPILGIVGTASWPRSVTFRRVMGDAVPGARLVTVEDSNDPTPLCAPDAFHRILEGFLSAA